MIDEPILDGIEQASREDAEDAPFAPDRCHQFLNDDRVACPLRATKDVYWPGRVKPLPMCDGHAAWADRVLTVMGARSPITDRPNPGRPGKRLIEPET